MQITLSPEQTRLLELLARRGQHASLEETLNRALELLVDEMILEQEDSPEYREWLEKTRLLVAEGIEQADRGDYWEADVAITQLREKLRKAREESE